MSGWGTATVAIVSLAATAVGTYASMQQQQQQQAAQEKQARYQAEVAQKNQDLADEQARAQRKEGYDNMIRKRQETAKLIGKQRAQMGASGAVVDFGSAMDVSQDTAEQGEFDAMAAYQQGLNGAYNAEIQRWNYGQQAAGYKMQADSVGAGNGWGAVGALAGGIGSAAGSLGSIGGKADWWGIGKGTTTPAKTSVPYTETVAHNIF